MAGGQFALSLGFYFPWDWEEDGSDEVVASSDKGGRGGREGLLCFARLRSSDAPPTNTLLCTMQTGDGRIWLLMMEEGVKIGSSKVRPAGTKPLPSGI